MELLFIALVIFMLLLIVAGTVAFCAMVRKEARRAARNSEAAFDALARHESDLEEGKQEFVKLKERVAEIERQSATGEDKVDEHMQKMMGWMPENFGLRFGGEVKNED